MSTPNLSTFKLFLIGSICVGLVFGIVVWASGKKMSVSQALQVRVRIKQKTFPSQNYNPRKRVFLR